MEMVPPGDVTGYYYIIVAGLPWNCSWQKLKDICKDQQPDGTCLEVDHVVRVLFHFQLLPIPSRSQSAGWWTPLFPYFS